MERLIFWLVSDGKHLFPPMTENSRSLERERRGGETKLYINKILMKGQ